MTNCFVHHANHVANHDQVAQWLFEWKKGFKFSHQTRLIWLYFRVSRSANYLINKVNGSTNLLRLGFEFGWILPYFICFHIPSTHTWVHTCGYQMICTLREYLLPVSIKSLQKMIFRFNWSLGNNAMAHAPLSMQSAHHNTTALVIQTLAWSPPSTK